MTIELGDKCRDIVSGFVGFAVVRSEYISGYIRIGLQPTVYNHKKLPDVQYFDEPMLFVLED